jgi:RNA polymerase sigma factor (sigma-70 family)
MRTAMQRKQRHVTQAHERELLVLPPVADDPVFVDDRGTSACYTRPVGNDPHEFAALYMRHRWSFGLHARRFLHDQRDVDEVVQEGFLKLFLALPELDNELQALAYARRTITNLCIDRYRADQRRPRLVDLESVQLELADDDEIDPVVAAEDAAIVREALALLSPLHREALIKREVEEKPLPQIAAELDIPVEQVKHVLHRARRSLRRLLVGTHVEPGVDLDLITVLAANRARMAAAAKPTGAAAIALLLVLAGVIGLRSSDRGGKVMGAAPSAGPLLGDPAPLRGTVGVTASTTHVAAPPKASVTRGHATAPRHSSAGTSAGSTAGAPAVVHSAPPVKPPVTQPVAPPVAPPVVRPETTSRLSLSGLLSASTHPEIEGTQTFDTVGGTTAAFSKFVAPTDQGPLVLTQTLSNADDGSVTYAADAALPVDGAAVPAQLGAADVPAPTVTKNADGTVNVVIDTTFTLPVAPTGALPASDRFVVQALYAPDLTTVLAERVVVGGPDDPLPALTASGYNDTSTLPLDGSTVRPGPTTTDLSTGRENPVGRDQEPLPSS